jgi:hypothetical protein
VKRCTNRNIPWRQAAPIDPPAIIAKMLSINILLPANDIKNMENWSYTYHSGSFPSSKALLMYQPVLPSQA